MLKLDMRTADLPEALVAPGPQMDADVRVDVVPGGVEVVAETAYDLDWWLRGVYGESLSGDALEEIVLRGLALATKITDAE